MNQKLRSLPIHLHDPWYRFSHLFDECEKAGLAPKNQNVLDLGCAQGFLEKLLIERWNCTVEGWDYQDYRWKDQLLDQWNFHLHDVAKEWPRREAFDAIFALEVIEHMIDTDLFLERCHSFLKPKGKLILSTPNIACLQNRARLALGKYQYLMEYRNAIHHVRMYTVPTLLNHLEEKGFKTLLCCGVNLLPIRAHKIAILKNISVSLANRWPSLCSQVLVIAEPR
ncbi:class I SAM-dependent methyltransferase [Synechococcus elongatus IITB4]|uniref:class I SAM-dependent methyltransferase n=1 Tax=Synechococcus elongatus TaxID=32046 RepID=UPI0030CF0A33